MASIRCSECTHESQGYTKEGKALCKDCWLIVCVEEKLAGTPSNLDLQAASIIDYDSLPRCPPRMKVE
jgi:hypothetical protein